MGIVIKHTLKNIFCKPLRTIVVVFSIFLCALSGLLCFDLVGEMKAQIADLYSSVLGQADLLFYGKAEERSDTPPCTILPVKLDLTYFYSDVEGEYNYAHYDSVSIYSFDFERAGKMGVYTENVPGDDEAMISGNLADKFGYSTGDKIWVKDRINNKHELTVAGILPNDSRNYFFSGLSMIVSDRTIDAMSGGIDLEASLELIDVTDDSRIDEMETYLKEHFPGANLESVKNTEAQEEMMSQITGILALIFAFTILLVVFVTISICEKIISERMSVIGTLRSLGMNNFKTACILLMENVFYALMGSIPAVLVYALIRTPILSGMINTTDSEGNTIAIELHPLSLLIVAGIIVACITVECLLPLKAVIAAMKTPIRDIIFDNRDTAYIIKRRSVITGCVFLAASVILWFFHTNLYCMVAFVVTTVVALSLLIPAVIILMSKGLRKLFANGGHMSWELASREMSARKSTVGSGVLCATSAAICIVILAVCSGVLNTFVMPESDWDAQISLGIKPDYLRYAEDLEGVTDHEYRYNSGLPVLVNGKKIESVDVCGMPDGGFRMTHDYSGLPSSIEDGCIAVDSSYARRKNVRAGDKIVLTVDPEGVFPIEREFTVSSIFDVTGGYLNWTVFIISLDDYIRIYGDNPSMLYLKCEDPEQVLSTVRKYSSMYIGDDTLTRTEYEERESGDTGPVVAGLTTILIIGVGMTFIGTASNQIIGFEGRKRECAVMLSTSMSSRKLSGVLFKEVLLTSLISALTGSGVGIALMTAISNALYEIGNPVIIRVSPAVLILFILGLTLVFTLTVLIPVRTLHRMKISEQLKYE